MSTNSDSRHDSVEYTEFTVEGRFVALLADPTRAHAWIRSDYTVPVRE